MKLKIITASHGEVIIDDVVGILVLEEEEFKPENLSEDYKDFLRNFPDDEEEKI